MVPRISDASTNPDSKQQLKASSTRDSSKHILIVSILNMPIRKVKRSTVASQSESYTRGDFYGRFIFLGYHESDKTPQRNTQFVLWRRERPNGLKFTVRVSARPRKPMRPGTLLRRHSPRVLKRKHGIEFKVEKCDDHDLFQFGRDPHNNDFHIPGHQINGRNSWASNRAFHVLCNRETGQVRIYAGGLDPLNHHVISGPKWETELPASNESSVPVLALDGGITAGLYVWKPHIVKGSETYSGEWYEASAMGSLYRLRTDSGERGDRAEEWVNNTLTDGCIIVNAENVFYFSTAPQSEDCNILTNEALESILRRKETIFCPITLDPIELRDSTISGPLPRNIRALHTLVLSQHRQQGYPNGPGSAGVYPCGHVFQLPSLDIQLKIIRCPSCRGPGPIERLKMQASPIFRIPSDVTVPTIPTVFTHFLLCRHAVSEQLGRMMAAVPLPTNEILGKISDSNSWVRCLKGSQRRCWLCGEGFLTNDLKKLFYSREVDQTIN